MDFPLSRAREILFDRQLWEIFVSYFETSESAYERIGLPRPPDAPLTADWSRTTPMDFRVTKRT